MATVGSGKRRGTGSVEKEKKGKRDSNEGHLVVKSEAAGGRRRDQLQTTGVEGAVKTKWDRAGRTCDWGEAKM